MVHCHPVPGKDTPKAKRPIVVMDHERCIRAKDSLAMLRRNGIEVLKGYPKGSPDLNPIENIWGILKSEVYHTRNFPAKMERRNDFIARVRRLTRRDSRDVNLLRNTGWKSYKERIEAVIANNGNKTTF